MRCPVCKKEVLIALEYESVEIDYCPECKGIWLDAGEIELLFGDADAATAFLTIGKPAVVPQGEKRRRCPECNKKMTKESTESEHPVTFDHCPNGDGLWFDAGELAIILKHAGELVGANTVADYLREIFPETTDQKQKNSHGA